MPAKALRTLKGVIDAATRLPPLRAAVVHPVTAHVMESVRDAREQGLLDPMLVGPPRRIHAAAEAVRLDLKGVHIVPTEHSHAAVASAIALARAAEVAALVKGSLTTAELMEGVVSRDNGLRTDRRMSHVFVMEVKTYPRLLLITDAALNIAPTLEQKRDIAQNAIDLAHALHIARPHVALLSAIETVTSRLPSTVEAAALCKMAERGQVHGGVLDGPLAFDNAISRAAAREKNLRSTVSGHADVLLVPDVESGNLLAKQLSYLAGARAAGIVQGARVPIVLTSRAADTFGRLSSIAVASLVAAKRAPRKRVR